MSLWLLWHTLAAVASLNRDAAWGARAYDLTRPYEQLLGVWQRWPMFARNPTPYSFHMELEQYTDAGEWSALAVPGPALDPVANWRSPRIGKFQTWFSRTNGGPTARKGIRGICRVQEPKPIGVRVIRVWRPTPKPEDAAGGRGPWRREEVASEWCP